MAASMAYLVALIALAFSTAQAAFLLPPLPFDPSTTEPVIDAKTNTVHHDGFHAEHITRTNAAVAAVPDFAKLTLTALVGRVGTGTLPPAIEVEIRNQAGGAWNHNLWWLILAKPGSKEADIKQSLSPELSSAIDKSFGSFEEMAKKFSAVSKAHFGSGWTWLIVRPDGGLQILDTNNQDNTLMKLPGVQPGIPILGADLWEHNFLYKYANNRYSFIDAFPSAINWARVSKNYGFACAGDAGAIIGKEFDEPK